MTEETTETTEQQSQDSSSIWESFEKDSETGYYVDPSTGALYDPDSGSVMGGDTLPDFEGTAASEASSEISN